MKFWKESFKRLLNPSIQGQGMMPHMQYRQVFFSAVTGNSTGDWQLHERYHPLAAKSFHYVHYSRAKEGIKYLVLAVSVCLQCLGNTFLCPRIVYITEVLNCSPSLVKINPWSTQPLALNLSRFYNLQKSGLRFTKLCYHSFLILVEFFTKNVPKTKKVEIKNWWISPLNQNVLWNVLATRPSRNQVIYWL